MRAIRRYAGRFWRNERGATAIEYGLIAGLMVVAIVGSLHSFASANDEIYETIESNIVKS